LRVVRACWLATAAVLQPCVMPCHKAQREHWRSTLRVCSSPGPCSKRVAHSRLTVVQCSSRLHAVRAPPDGQEATLEEEPWGEKAECPCCDAFLHPATLAGSFTCGTAHPRPERAEQARTWGSCRRYGLRPLLRPSTLRQTAGAKQRHGHVQEKTSALAAPMKPCSAEKTEGGAKVKRERLALRAQCSSKSSEGAAEMHARRRWRCH
jgi:hypothetical protein